MCRVLILASVLGVTNFPLHRLCEIFSLLDSKSTFCHRRASNSPARRPVTARQTKSDLQYAGKRCSTLPICSANIVGFSFRSDFGLWSFLRIGLDETRSFA